MYDSDYDLPQQIHIACQTDRGELCFAYAKSIRAENELAAAFAMVIGALLDDRRKCQNAIIQNRDRFDAFAARLESALKLARGEELEQVERGV